MVELLRFGSNTRSKNTSFAGNSEPPLRPAPTPVRITRSCGHRRHVDGRTGLAGASHAATSSRSIGSSSPVPVLLTRLDTCHITEHRLIGDSLRARVEARWHFLQCLLRPPRNQAPAHRDQLARAFGRCPHDIDRVRRRDVVVALQIASGAVREFVQVVDFMRGAAFADRTFTRLTRGAMPLRNRTCPRSVCGSRTAKCCSRRTLPRQTAAARCGGSYRSPSMPR